MAPQKAWKRRPHWYVVCIRWIYCYNVLVAIQLCTIICRQAVQYLCIGQPVMDSLKLHLRLQLLLSNLATVSGHGHHPRSKSTINPLLTVQYCKILDLSVSKTCQILLHEFTTILGSYPYYHIRQLAIQYTRQMQRASLNK